MPKRDGGWNWLRWQFNDPAQGFAAAPPPSSANQPLRRATGARFRGCSGVQSPSDRGEAGGLSNLELFLGGRQHAPHVSVHSETAVAVPILPFFFPAKRFLLPFSVVGRCGNVALFFSLLLYLFVLFFLRAHFAFFARRMLKTFGAVFCSPNTEQASCVYLAWHSLHARIRTAQTITSRQYCLLYPEHVHVVYASVWYLQ